MKKLIDKIKKDENDINKNKNNNKDNSESSNDDNNYLKYNLMPNDETDYSNNSELFTLGNATAPNLNIMKNNKNKTFKNNKSKNKEKRITKVENDNLKLVIQKSEKFRK